MGHQLGTYTEQKHYLHATTLLSASVAQLEGDLLEVDALRDVRMELTAKKEVRLFPPLFLRVELIFNVLCIKRVKKR